MANRLMEAERTDPRRRVIELLERAAQACDAGRLDDAEGAFREALFHDGGEHRALFGLGLVALRRGDAQAAWDHAHHAIRVEPSFAEAHHLAGEALRAKGETERAVLFYRRALAMRPGCHEAALGAAIGLAELGALAEAAESLQRQLLGTALLGHRDDPALPNAHRLLGALWHKLGIFPRRERRTAAPPAGRRPRVLIVCPRWHGLKPDLRPSLEHYATVTSLEASGLADVVGFFPDEAAAPGRSPEGALLAVARAEPADAIVYVHLSHANVFRLDALRLLRELTRVPIVMMHTDSAGAWNVWAGDALTPLGDLNVTMDGAGGYQSRSLCPEEWLGLWTPLDPALFHAAGGARDVGVCFVGTIAGNPVRQAALAHLERNGVDVLVRGGGVAEGSLSFAEYAALYRRARIVLNFSQVRTDLARHHLKGRVFEAMACGALLLETVNPETTRFFIPGREYETFADQEELLAKVRRLLADEPARAAIAARGHARVTTEYTAERFWRAVLERVGVLRCDAAAPVCQAGSCAS